MIYRFFCVFWYKPCMSTKYCPRNFPLFTHNCHPALSNIPFFRHFGCRQIIHKHLRLNCPKQHFNYNSHMRTIQGTTTKKDRHHYRNFYNDSGHKFYNILLSQHRLFRTFFNKLLYRSSGTL